MLLQDLHLNGDAEVPTCRFCKLNHSINVFYVAIPNQIILHTCYSSHSNQIILHTCYFHSVAPCLKQCQTKPNVPPCRLCKLNDSINMFYVAIPNQIILHTCYSSHCNSMWKCQTKPHKLQKYMAS